MTCPPRSRAFTLVELGVVLAVVAILMSFSVTRMQGFRENAAFERIADDLDGLSQVGMMYISRGGTNFGWVNVTASPPIMQAILPPGFLGTNPLNNGPYQIQVNNFMVDVRTVLPPNSQWVQTWNPSVVVNPPACAGGCTVSLRERWLPPASMVPLLMESRYLYRDCCCPGGSCAPTCSSVPPIWYCP